MHRIYMFLFALVVTVFSTAYFSSSGIAGEVTRINKNKGHVFINEGKDAGFFKGATVCFFSSSGEELLCGRVLRTQDAYAVVKVDNREAKKVKIGTEARLTDEKDEKNVN